MNISTPKGTKDIFGTEVETWQLLETEIRNLCTQFHIGEVRTPVFEHTEIFIKGSGDATDVVQKEMYTFTDKGNRSITLKPEVTPGVARAFLVNKLYAGVQPTKLYYISPCFRYEQPQDGRQRQFHQFGIECFGSYSSAADAEVISLAYELFRRLGLKNTELHINSLGGEQCRKVYNAKVKEFLSHNLDGLCPLCKDRFERNTLRVLDCKVDACKKIIEDAPSVLDCLGEECTEHFNTLKKILTAMDIPFTVDPRIVRGLDYYTRTVFEFVCTDLGAQSTICGGGRYDNLIEGYGGPKTGGIGFGLGMERLLKALANQNNQPQPAEKNLIFIGASGDEGFLKAQELIYRLRQKGLNAEGDTLQRSVKAQFKYADKIGATYAMIIGDQELKTATVNAKNMKTGEQTQVSLTPDALYNHTNNI